MLCLLVWFGAFLPGSGVLAEVPLLLTDVDIREQGEQARIRIHMSRPVEYHAFLLESPPRLVVDMPPFRWKVANDPLLRQGGAVVKRVRHARFDASTSRLVFDLSRRVILEEERQKAATGQLEIILKAVEGVAERVSSVDPSEHRNPNYPLPVLKPVKVTAATERPLIVIDPGHGGVDPGTTGEKGVREKDITLSYAQRLRDALLATGRFRALLTRDDDRFIRLRERIHIAREAGAKLFISLHADSAPTLEARGLSVYTLSEDASDEEAAALAAQENKADIIAGIDLSHERGDVMDILIDLAQRETKNKSVRLAELLVRELGKQVRLLPNTHRFAGFAVLKAPDVPSVIIEIGFLSHPEEEKRIQQKEHRDKVVQGIVKAVVRYFDDH